MKNLLIGLVLSVAVSAPVFADEAPSVNCTELSGVARAVMSARQTGVPMHKVMAVAGDNVIYKRFVMESFEEHQYSSKSVRDQVINEYGNKWHLICLKAFGEK